jgi:peptidyl-prolyl cis-trans isomerase D
MISWIQHHLIRHGRWIFLTLLSVIIVAFVFTIGNTPGCTSDQSAYESVDFYGYDLNSQREIDLVAQKVSLSSMLNGQQMRTQQQFETALMSRIAILALVDELQIPKPTQAVLTEFVKTKAAFRGAEGSFSADAYTRFVDQMELNPQIQKGLVVVTLEEDYQIEQVRNSMAGPGYVLPAEAKAEVQKNKSLLSLSTAEIAYVDFNPEINPSEETLKAYYQANSNRYEIAERIVASYLTFETTSFSDAVTEPSESDLRAHFTSKRAQFVAEYSSTLPTPAEGEEAPTVAFEDVQPAVLTNFKNERAKRLSNEAAQEFAYTLYANEIKRDSAAFNTLLNENGLTLTKIQPFTATGAAQRALPAEMLRSAFALSDNRYYTDAYAMGDDFAVLIYQDRIDPLIPEFEAVTEEVTVNYLAEEKRRLFNVKGVELKTALESALSEDTDFSEVAESLDLVASDYEDFLVSETPEGLAPSIAQQALNLEVGSISPMIQNGATGTFIYLKSKIVPEIASDDADFTQTYQFLSNYNAFMSANTLGNELITRGLPQTADTTNEE